MGGIESVTESLARGAADAGHSATVVCFDKAGPSEETGPRGLRVLRAPIQGQIASQPLGLQYLTSALREGRAADVVHIHAPNMLAALAALMLGRGPKLVVHWHSDVVNKGWLGSASRPLERALLRRADRIVCTSQAYADGSVPLRDFVHKVSVVPIGVTDVAHTPADIDAIAPALRERLSGKRLVLAVGRLVPYKGFHVLIDAASKIVPDAVVVIVGTGPLQSELETQIAANGLEDKVVLAGRQDSNALRSLFQRADLFCLPSVERSEAFGVVLIEAMSYALPVVTTQVPASGVSWVNADGVSGLNVPVGDHIALAEACNTILDSDAVRRRFAHGARQRFVAEFTEQLAIDRMFAIYRELLANRTDTVADEDDIPVSTSSV
jgi:glycosyltransferase involved in cell wall biosynthesis